MFCLPASRNNLTSVLFYLMAQLATSRLHNCAGVLCCRYIKNMPENADRLFLYEKFAPFGAIHSVKVRELSTTRLSTHALMYTSTNTYKLYHRHTCTCIHTNIHTHRILSPSCFAHTERQLETLNTCGLLCPGMYVSATCTLQ